MPKFAMKSMQQRPWILGALAAALWITPAAAQTAGGTATPGRDGSGEADRTEQAAAAGGTGSSAEPDHASQASPAESQTSAATGQTSANSGASTTSKDPARSVLDEDPGRWPYAGRSSSDRAQ